MTIFVIESRNIFIQIAAIINATVRIGALIFCLSQLSILSIELLLFQIEM